MFHADSPLAVRSHLSPNSEPRRSGLRPTLLILHYTGMRSSEKAIDWLSRPESKVSAHYVIDETGVITQLVPEHLRAWHAGQSYWRGETDINSASIGIEIHNPGHEMGYPDFPAAQMASVVALSLDIARRNAIARDGILAHSDVAPRRKIDPGEKFNWKLLADAGAAHWVEPVAVDPSDPGLGVGAAASDVGRAQAGLAGYGYEVAVTGVLDDATRFALRAFQLRFRPARVDGRLDSSTAMTIARLGASAADLPTV